MPVRPNCRSARGTTASEVPLRALVRDVMPFLAVMIGALALITLVPDLVLFLPRLLGYKG